jgi:phosphoribosylaminoimidazole carboxylase
MLAHPAALLSIPLLILDLSDSTPAKQVISPPPPHTSHIDGPFTSRPHILELASKVDILTVEIEHVDADVLLEIQAQGDVEVHPDPRTIKVIQDKYEQKKYLVEKGEGAVRVAEFEGVQRSEQDPSVVESSIKKAAEALGLPLMLKARTLAYDGRGNHRLESTTPSALSAALDFLGDRPLYAEKWAPFKKEIAVMVVRTPNGEVRSYDAVETVHEESVLRLVLCPLREGRGVAERARAMAEKAVGCLVGAGIFGVEMFLMPDGESRSRPALCLGRQLGKEHADQDLFLISLSHSFLSSPPLYPDSLLINEIAPRPHNSGHHTIEACHTSQFENHLRAISSLPLGSTALKVPSSAMINLIGSSSSPDDINRCVRRAFETEGASVHLYGKKECRKGRKMGHITVVAESESELRESMREIFELSLPESSKLPGTFCPPPPQGAKLNDPHPLVGIIMGSDSDLPTMAAAAQILTQFNVPFELTIVSAHRTPDRMVEYAREAAGRGLRCIIAGAGGAAHLPGMVAAMTALPVVGVPVKGSVLDGVDSLHSIVQMPVRPFPSLFLPLSLSFDLERALSDCGCLPLSPFAPQRGIPVATIAIGNSTNAGLLAVRIVSASVPRLIKEMESYLSGLEKEVMSKAEKLESIGYEAYLAGMQKK